MGLVRNTVVFGVGYVMGARAGKERYEQLKQQGQALLQRPEVQQAWQRAKGTAAGRVRDAVQNGPDTSAPSGTGTPAPAPVETPAPAAPSRPTGPAAAAPVSGTSRPGDPAAPVAGAGRTPDR